MNLVINAHKSFSDDGATDNPFIGTTEDWFVNTLLGPDLPHSMHVHLIIFQAISQGEIKKVPLSDPTSFNVCTFYEVEYYLTAGALPSNKTYNEYCNIIRGFNYDDSALNKILDDAFREDKPTKGTDYGFDVFTLMTGEEFASKAYSYPECP